ncbi:hypothetical protein Zmor_002604 [Zophobas morio]|uniref:oxaloacetate tautomerase n=1 Tax=Zophobas morio TaxID=2755281 RepID=A0AA38J6U1_9CUCU|nr:hypothetical protein Zmor_002604 [Zophobas morio]
MTDLSQFVRNGKKIIGVAANYKSLLKILERPVPELPEIFLKPTSSYITEGQPILIPHGFTVNQEIELGVVIGKKGKHISEDEAMNHVGGYCAALDMTAPCRMVRFDTACPVSAFVTKSKIENPHNVRLWCKVNNELKQDGNTNDMIFTIPKLISFISQYMTLEENDLIVTGSPPGMGPVQPGDVIEGGIDNLISFKFCVSQ